MYQDQDLLNHKLLQWSEKTFEPNLRGAPCINIPMTEEGIQDFNQLIEICEDVIGNYRIVYTPSGGIKKNGPFNRYGITYTSTTVELDIHYMRRICRIIFGKWTTKEEGGGISGSQAYRNFRKTMLKFNVDIEDYMLESKEEGKELNKTIPPPIIQVAPWNVDTIFENVHHLDLNSAYLSGIKDSYPEWGPGLDYMYEQRKVINNMKAVMVYTVGYFHSKWLEFKLAHIAKEGICWNDRQIRSLIDKLNNSGRKVLCINTDGIWYQGDIYHDEQEGIALGQWKTDHTNCTFRAKSSGAYEYIEGGIYHPVVRGPCKRDSIMSRDQWVWGDIYRHNTQVLDYRFNPITERVEIL